jgi:putative glutamine amidotransferase
MASLIGISCCQKRFDASDGVDHAASDTYVQAVSDIIGGFPLLIPANGTDADVERLLELFDGLILTGSYSNVGPGLYGGDPHPGEVLEDPHRDAMTLPLIRAAVAAGMPLLGICRGFQELNVALGGTLHQCLQTIPGKINHWTPLRPLELLRDAKAHHVHIVDGGWLHRLSGTRRIMVNSHHNQGIDRLAPSLVAEATAPDGTIEAVRVDSGPGFAVGVQWHPEYDMGTNATSRRIFESFGGAVARYRQGRPAPLSAPARRAVRML